jgi:tetratricopeptide (TPR) repeat protein
MFEKLYALHPEKAHGPGYIAVTYWAEATRGWSDSHAETLRQAAEWATKAISYEDHDGLGYVILSYIRLHEGRHDEALALSNKALEYRSNCPAALGQEAVLRLYIGDAPGAVKSARESMMVRPMLPPVLINVLAAAYRDNGQIELSIPAAREAVRLDPTFIDGLVTLYSLYVLAGDDDEARNIAHEILAADPKFGISDYLTKHPYKDRSTLEQLGETLRAAGLPE